MAQRRTPSGVDVVFASRAEQITGARTERGTPSPQGPGASSHPVDEDGVPTRSNRDRGLASYRAGRSPRTPPGLRKIRCTAPGGRPTEPRGGNRELAKPGTINSWHRLPGDDPTAGAHRPHPGTWMREVRRDDVFATLPLPGPGQHLGLGAGMQHGAPSRHRRYDRNVGEWGSRLLSGGRVTRRGRAGSVFLVVDGGHSQP